jgi:uncharacterized protein
MNTAPGRSITSGVARWKIASSRAWACAERASCGLPAAGADGPEGSAQAANRTTEATAAARCPVYFETMMPSLQSGEMQRRTAPPGGRRTVLTGPLSSGRVHGLSRTRRGPTGGAPARRPPTPGPRPPNAVTDPPDAGARAARVEDVLTALHHTPMQPRLTVLTLGVDDLERAVAFYRDGLGWPTPGVVGREFAHGAVAFFDLAGGPKLALWTRADLAHDAGVSLAPPSATELSLGYNVNGAGAVDATIAHARRAGATIVKEPARTFWGGYAGYFADPDGHLWEVVWNPALTVPD